MTFKPRKPQTFKPRPRKPRDLQAPQARLTFKPRKPQTFKPRKPPDLQTPQAT